jgi:glutaredoxin 3
MSREPEGPEIEDALYELTNQYTVPNIFIGGQHIGGSDDLKKLHVQGKLVNLLQ